MVESDISAALLNLNRLQEKQNHCELTLRDKLTPPGGAAPNAPKWFVVTEMIRLVVDQDWLHKATKEIPKYWRHKCERHRTRLPSTHLGNFEADEAN